MDKRAGESECGLRTSGHKKARGAAARKASGTTADPATTINLTICAMGGTSTVKMGRDAVIADLARRMHQLHDIHHRTSTFYVAGNDDPLPAAEPVAERTEFFILVKPLTDRLLLEALYHDTGGGRKAGWMTDAPLTEWHGVRANAEGTCLGLTFEARACHRTSLDSLGDLTAMKYLRLRGRNISSEFH